MNRALVLLIVSSAFLVASVSHAVVLVNEDFEGAFPPAGWTAVHNSGTGNFAFTSVTGHDGSGGSSGSAGHIGDSTSNNGDAPAGWAQLPGTVDANYDWTLTADIKFEHEASADDGGIFVGDLGPNRDFYYSFWTEADQNNDLIYHDNNVRQGGPNWLIDGHTSGLADDTWYQVTMNWTAATETLDYDISTIGGTQRGSYSIVLDGSNPASNPNPSLKSLAGGAIQIGIGTYNDRTSFDNVALTSAAVIPEPSTLLVWSLLAGLGIGLAWRRRRK